MRTKRLARATLLTLLLCLAMTPTLRADELPRGSWAAQFRVANDFTLSNFGGNVLSLKKHLSPANALRASVDLLLRHTTQDQFDGVVSIERREEDLTQVGFSFDYLRYFAPRSSLSLFLGAGPFFRLSDATSIRFIPQLPEPQSTTQRDERSYGVRGVLGLEWFVTNSIGLHSEYGVEASRATSDSSHEPGGHESRIKSWGVSGKSVFLGASVYF